MGNLKKGSQNNQKRNILPTLKMKPVEIGKCDFQLALSVVREMHQRCKLILKGYDFYKVQISLQ